MSALVVPSREDWESRQAALPDAARAALAAHAARMLDLAAERRREIEEAARKCREHRAAFESQVAAVLEAVGGVWLAGYRVPDAHVAGLPAFDLWVRQYTAEFDARAIGVWPIYLHLEASERRDGAVIWAPIHRPWSVQRADDARGFQLFPDALAFAVSHPSPPF